ncbi:extracellular catalytic domain type 1 short-chain-length polyhydroxyalkanoate depolymerase [Arenibaculum pallidiluteum]|uniref:extracellular catalytic domain type 1 short-chain-length polyhydroxyalkanoate depolymerase n=1 Tax=Arenibaculum pallidiluteum TaxID=2812559 RepID=UPI001A95A212|nr:PHB depolymerase family esterase [Arenibaculum pallidiluteum]
MNQHIHPEMAEAARLTRAGRLAEAMALIQRLLRGGGDPGRSAAPDGAARQGPSGASSGAARPGSGTVIDAEAIEVDADGKARAASGKASSERARTARDGTREGAGEGGGPRLQDMLRDLVGRLAPSSLPSSAGAWQPGASSRAWQQPGAPGPAAEVEPAPPGAQFLARSFVSEAGSRDYRLYVPAARSGGPMPLVVMLHGCKQSPEDFAAGTRMNVLAEEFGFLVAYPGQSSKANASKCWNWFSPADQQRGRGEPALIAGIVREIMAGHPVDPGRVYVTGLSAGGAQAAVMASAYPDLFAAVGVHSGLACGAARDVPSAFAAMRSGAPGAVPDARDGARLVPTIVFHGDRDATVHPSNGDAVMAQFRAGGNGAAAGLRREVESGQAPGGRAYSRESFADASGRVLFEQWTVHGAGHAWSGGSPQGSYTDPQGPDASREMLRFFLAHEGARGRPAA